MELFGYKLFAKAQTPIDTSIKMETARWETTTNEFANENITNEKLFSRSKSIRACMNVIVSNFVDYEIPLLPLKPNQWQTWDELKSLYINSLKTYGVTNILNSNGNIFIADEKNISRKNTYKDPQIKAVVNIEDFSLTFTNPTKLVRVVDIGYEINSRKYLKRTDGLFEALNSEIKVYEAYNNVLAASGGIFVSPDVDSEAPRSELKNIIDNIKKSMGLLNKKSIFRFIEAPIKLSPANIDFKALMPTEMLLDVKTATANSFQVPLELVGGASTYENQKQALLNFQLLVANPEFKKFANALSEAYGIVYEPVFNEEAADEEDSSDTATLE
ncbi:MAG: hypothetical protein ACRCS4_00485, partial [Flavobacterium sp.]